MPESHAARGARRGRRALVSLGEEIRAARVAAGLSQARVARAADISSSELSRIELGKAAWVDIPTAASVCAVVGLDLSVRAYPGASPLRDAAHLRLVEWLRRELDPNVVLRTEVPIGDGRDQRAWDAVLQAGPVNCAVEFETRMSHAQAVLRKVNLKRQASGVDRVVLVLADTNTNRRAVLGAREYLRPTFPLDPAAILSALRDGRLPESGGIVFLRARRVPRE